MKKYQEVLKQLFKALDSFKPQEAAYYEYLTDVMKDHYYPVDTILYEQGQVVKRAHFLSSGFAISYYYNDEGERQVIRIHEKNEIIAGKSFTDQTPSDEYLMACRDSYWLSLTYNEVEEIYGRFPDTQEQSRLIVAAREKKELERNRLLVQEALPMVESFYKTYPGLAEPGKIIKDADICSYLMISESSLRVSRAKLVKLGRLPGFVN